MKMPLLVGNTPRRAAFLCAFQHMFGKGRLHAGLECRLRRLESLSRFLVCQMVGEIHGDWHTNQMVEMTF